LQISSTKRNDPPEKGEVARRGEEAEKKHGINDRPRRNEGDINLKKTGFHSVWICLKTGIGPPEGVSISGHMTTSYPLVMTNIAMV
jgi:hypothetical protein